MSYSNPLGKIYFIFFFVTFNHHKVSDLLLWHLPLSKSSRFYGERVMDQNWKKSITSALCENGEQTSSTAPRSH
jgi:hypothetical protein